MVKIEHIGIAVNHLDDALPLYEKLLNAQCYKTEHVASEFVNTAFINIGDSKIELLEATNENSAIAKFLARRGEGIHHIAFEVENIYDEMERLKNEGFQLLMDKPKDGADNKLVCFIHPKSAGGTLIEICQEKR